jgi:CRISPR-associated protein Cas5h
MQTIVFELSGDYALFKKPYSPMSPVSYPVPPPTAVMGMLGAIGGYPKDSCAEQLGWRDLRVAVRLLKPPGAYRTSLNLLNTKDGTDAFFRPKADANTHIQVPCEFLKDVAYRVFVAGLNDTARGRIAAILAAGRTAYTVSLGWASCLADVRWQGMLGATPLQADEWQCDTLVPLDEGVRVRYDEGRRYHRFKLPVAMDEQRQVHRYQEVALAEDGAALQGSGRSNRLYRVGDETVAFL